MTEYFSLEDKEILKLSEWENANLHLSPVTTLTLYKGSAPIDFLRSRIALILEKNPWITSRLVKKNSPEGEAALVYSKAFDLQRAVDRHLAVYEPGEAGFSLNGSYEEIVQDLLPGRCAGSNQAFDNDEVLFKVAVVPLEAGEEQGDRSMP